MHAATDTRVSGLSIDTTVLPGGAGRVMED
jgi:hypothetical protein